jgi:3-deoxy-D-manno-octulosonic-acid transferase
MGKFCRTGDLAEYKYHQSVNRYWERIPFVPYILNVIYFLLIVFAMPWLIWQVASKGKYREGYAEKFFGLAPMRIDDRVDEIGNRKQNAEDRERGAADGGKKCVWFHAVSVGEVNLLIPLLKIIKERMPDWECVISSTTKTGLELAKKKFPDLASFYCPLDFTWAAATAMRRIRPDVFVLAELELWPNLIRAAKKCGAKVVVINGRLGEKSFRGYSRIRPFIAKILRKIDLVAVQDETYAERFCMLGTPTENVHVTGSMKFDGAQTDRENPNTKRLAALAGLNGDDVVWLAGSTQEPEESIVLDVFQRLAGEFPDLRLAIVPRHPERFEAVAKIIEQTGMEWRRRTELQESVGQASPDTHTIGKSCQARPNLNGTASNIVGQSLTYGKSTAKILLVDVVGELGAWWGTAKIAFVGGSFGNRGGQNMIEPAAYGAAVSFGPNTWNFKDIVSSLLANNAAVELSDAAALEKFVRRCLIEPWYADELGQRAKKFVVSQIGATQRTFKLLESLEK